MRRLRVKPAMTWTKPAMTTHWLENYKVAGQARNDMDQARNDMDQARNDNALVRE